MPALPSPRRSRFPGLCFKVSSCKQFPFQIFQVYIREWHFDHRRLFRGTAAVLYSREAAETAFWIASCKIHAIYALQHCCYSLQEWAWMSWDAIACKQARAQLNCICAKRLVSMRTLPFSFKKWTCCYLLCFIHQTFLLSWGVFALIKHALWKGPVIDTGNAGSSLACHTSQLLGWSSRLRWDLQRLL